MIHQDTKYTNVLVLCPCPRDVGTTDSSGIDNGCRPAPLAPPPIPISPSLLTCNGLHMTQCQGIGTPWHCRPALTRWIPQKPSFSSWLPGHSQRFIIILLLYIQYYIYFGFYLPRGSPPSFPPFFFLYFPLSLFIFI